MFLTPKELIELTDKRQSAAQSRQLDAMGIEYLKRGDGSLVVSCSHVEKILGGEYAKKPNIVEPNWSELDAQAA